MALPNPIPQGSPDPIRDLLDEKTLADEITKAIEGNDCPREKDLLAYVEKQLGEAERIEVKSHLVFCTRCQGKVKLLEQAPDTEPESEDPEDNGSSPADSRVPAQPRAARKALVPLVVVLALAGGLWFFILESAGSAYGIKIGHAVGALPGAEELHYQVRTPNPVYLIEIIIHGDGQITARIPPADGSSQYSDHARIPILPRARGELDLYVVTFPIADGFPNRQLSELLKFIRTEKSLNRENQRRGVQMALDFCHLQFLHEVFKFKG